MSPWEGSDPSDGWRQPWGPGPALTAWKIWLAPGRFCPLCPSAKWVVRPQTDEILSSWKPGAGVCRRDWGCGWDFISSPMLQQVSLSSTTCLTAGGPPPSAEGGKLKSRAGVLLRLVAKTFYYFMNKLFDAPAGEFIFHHLPDGRRSPSFCGRRQAEVSCWCAAKACGKDLLLFYE